MEIVNITILKAIEMLCNYSTEKRLGLKGIPPTIDLEPKRQSAIFRYFIFRLKPSFRWDFLM